MELQEFLRDIWQTSLVFISLLTFTRFLGNTQVGQLTFYEYISGITIGSIAATVAASEPDRVWSHFFDLLLFIILTYIISLITIKSRPLRKVIEGGPTLMIRNGQILEENMRKLRYDMDELTSQLRLKEILDPSEVQFAFLETSGELSVIKKDAHQTITKSDLAVAGSNPALPIELIMDGEVLEDNLKRHQITLQWLQEQLNQQGIQKPEQVMYAVIDSNGQFFLSKKSESA